MGGRIPQSIISQTLSRITPALPAHAYKSYGVVMPVSTHWRQASCAEVDCLHYREGWRTITDPSSELGQRQAAFIRNHSGRRFREERGADGMVTFEFEAGQRCFASDGHKLPAGRPPLYLVQGGDWRGNPTGERRVHARAEDWVDDFANHQDKIAQAVRRG